MDLEISQLDKTGLITDINEYLLAPEAFSEAYNVRFNNGSVESMKGYQEYKSPIAVPGGSLQAVKGISDKLYFFNGTKLHVMDASSYEEVDYPTGFAVTPEFYVNPFSNLPVITSDKTPYGLHKNDKDVYEIFKLKGWGDNVKARNVVSYKNFLFAFGVEIDSTLYEDTIFWSDISEPGFYPKDWGFQIENGDMDLTKPIDDSLGGYNQLSSIGGSIIAAEVFGDSLYLFTESEIFRVTQIGGKLVFRFSKVLTGKGVISPDSVIPVENGLVCIGSNDVYLFNGTTTQSISNNRINKWLNDKLLSDVDVKMIRDFNEKLLYIYFRSSQRPQDGFSQALVWDWVSNTFSLLDSSYTQFTDMSEYRADALLNVKNEQWDKETDKWDAGVERWEAEVKYGVGVMAIRGDQILILNRGYQIVTPTGVKENVSWNVKRKFYTNVMGYPESAIVRVHSVKFRGTEDKDVGVSINGKVGKRKGDTAYFRSTDKVFTLSIFGKGFMNLPSYVLNHSLIGFR